MEQQHSQLRMLGITPISWPDDAPDLNITPALAGSALLHCSSILPPPLLRHASDVSLHILPCLSPFLPPICCP